MQICSCHDSRSRRGHYTDRYHGPVHRLVSMYENAGASRRVQKFGYIYRHGNFSERISSDLLNGARFLLASARHARKMQIYVAPAIAWLCNRGDLIAISDFR